MTKERAAENERSSFFSSTADADTWRQGAARRAEVLGQATELMLDLAGVGAGCRVLDVAAGTGEQSLLAARRVGPTGSVLATDLSAQMLEVAVTSAREAGLENIQTRVMDAQVLDLAPGSFDAVISRLGLMFLSDLPGTLRNILGVLRPGGKFAAIVWDSADHNPLTVTAGALSRRYQLPWRTIPESQLFALGEQNALADALKLAGFQDVAALRAPANRRCASAAEAARELLVIHPLLSEARAYLPPEELARLGNDLEDSLREFEGPVEFVGPGAVVVGVGTR
jgi:SAM-dependent methyltransferase